EVVGGGEVDGAAVEVGAARIPVRARERQRAAVRLGEPAAANGAVQGQGRARSGADAAVRRAERDRSAAAEGRCGLQRSIADGEAGGGAAKIVVGRDRERAGGDRRGAGKGAVVA